MPRFKPGDIVRVVDPNDFNFGKLFTYQFDDESGYLQHFVVDDNGDETCFDDKEIELVGEYAQPTNEPKFYIIWNSNCHASPKVKFSSREAAFLEANRIALQYGQLYYVLEAVESFEGVTSVKRSVIG